jgi:hypothetical protein
VTHEEASCRGARIRPRCGHTQRNLVPRARERSGTTRLRRPVHAHEWSKPPPCVGTRLSR